MRGIGMLQIKDRSMLLAFSLFRAWQHAVIAIQPCQQLVIMGRDRKHAVFKPDLDRLLDQVRGKMFFSYLLPAPKNVWTNCDCVSFLRMQNAAGLFSGSKRHPCMNSFLTVLLVSYPRAYRPFAITILDAMNCALRIRAQSERLSHGKMSTYTP